MLSDAELADMRATLNSSLPDTAMIYRPTITNGGLGPTETWLAIGTVAVRVSPMQRTPFEGVRQAAVANVEDRQLTFPVGTDLAASDRVVVAGGTIEVTGVPTPRSWAVSLRAQGKIIR